VGDAVLGLALGEAVGELVGAAVGVADGEPDGELVGAALGEAVGAADGDSVGACVGDTDMGMITALRTEICRPSACSSAVTCPSAAAAATWIARRSRTTPSHVSTRKDILHTTQIRPLV
jgi:hypothetical protein